MREISHCKNKPSWNNNTSWNKDRRGTAARIRALPFTSKRRRTGTKGSLPREQQGNTKGTPREFTMRGGYSDVNWFL
ncbi:MAG: hypothetical protein WAR76_18080, partial [Xanthobacteraceae bacterium]